MFSFRDAGAKTFFSNPCAPVISVLYSLVHFNSSGWMEQRIPTTPKHKLDIKSSGSLAH